MGGYLGGWMGDGNVGRCGYRRWMINELTGV